ncbi:hypothetical protein VTO73DRAFT_3728 [Trametes versicolor]
MAQHRVGSSRNAHAYEFTSSATPSCRELTVYASSAASMPLALGAHILHERDRTRACDRREIDTASAPTIRHSSSEQTWLTPSTPGRPAPESGGCEGGHEGWASRLDSVYEAMRSNLCGGGCNAHAEVGSRRGLQPIRAGPKLEAQGTGHRAQDSALFHLSWARPNSYSDNDEDRLTSVSSPPNRRTDAAQCRGGDARDLHLHTVRHSGFGRDDGHDGHDGGALGSADSHRASSAVDGGARGRGAAQPWWSPGSCSIWASSTHSPPAAAASLSCVIRNLSPGDGSLFADANASTHAARASAPTEPLRHVVAARRGVHTAARARVVSRLSSRSNDVLLSVLASSPELWRPLCSWGDTPG